MSRWLAVGNMGGFIMRMKARASRSLRSVAVNEALFVVLDVFHKASKKEEAIISSHASAI